ncbi:hypothetical protein HYT58_01835, partial [Candidatus Woesearchaeota archaeon]|nr:hypothetical protein [Candidatus Woesearchaeota archaeon]
MIQDRQIILAALLVLAGSILSTGVLQEDISGVFQFKEGFMELSGYASASITPSCNSSNTVLKISSISNAHAGFWNVSTYNQNVCYTNDAGQDCSTNRSNVVLRLSGLDNAHAERKTDNTAGYLDVCFGSLSCDYNTDCTSLGPNYECLLSISSNTNAHVGDCNAYPLKVCCAKSASVCIDTDNDGLIGQPPPTACGADAFPTDPCSKVIQGDNCMGQGCNTDANNDGVADLCQPPCVLFGASWSRLTATDGQLVTLTVTGSLACNNASANFNIME